MFEILSAATTWDITDIGTAPSTFNTTLGQKLQGSREQKLLEASVFREEVGGGVE